MTSSQLLTLLDPFGAATGLSSQVRSDLCVLTAMDYALLTFVVGCVYLLLLRAVGEQRHGGEESASRTEVDTPITNRADILTQIRVACVNLLRWRCPVSSPTAAEIWFELQYYGIPVLVIGALLSLCIPGLMFLANTYHTRIPLVLVALTPVAPFFAAVSAAIWSRHKSWRTQVSAFEAARPIGTAKLIFTQTLVTSLCIAGAWLLMSASAWASLPLIKSIHDYGSPLILASLVIRERGLQLTSAVVVAFTLLTAVVAILAAVRALAGSYPRRFWFGAAGLALYVVCIAVALARGHLGEAVIGVHLWVVGISIPLGTLFALRRTLKDRLLTLRQLGAAALLWLLFAAAYLYLIGDNAIKAPLALGSLSFASTLLPLLAVGLAPWSLSRIRHN